MKVIAGTAGGVRLESVGEPTTRASLGRVRESLFSVLEPRLEGAELLDLFAGTGSLGIEALSRGGVRAVFVDNSRRSTDVLRRNLDRTGFASVSEVLEQNAMTLFRKERLAGQAFDLIFVDPPYPMMNKKAMRAAFYRMLQDLGEGQALKPDGIVVVKHEIGQLELPPDSPLALAERRRYRRAEVSILSAGPSNGPQPPAEEQ